MVIGITGGVGSGKSTVLSLLKNEYGATICMADELGHQAMEPGSKPYQEIVSLFGEDILLGNGSVDRTKLAGIVYANPEKLQALNEIIHPFVKDTIRELISQEPKNHLFILETAIMFETGCDELCDEVWGVITRDDIRTVRLMNDRGYSEEKAKSIMRQQKCNEELKELCNRILVNDKDTDDLKIEVRACMQNILEK